MAQQNRVGTTATTVIGGRSSLSVIYHETEVVRVQDGKITLNSGGWKTATTKTRMNQATQQFDLNFHVHTKRGSWTVNRREVDGEVTSRPFSDGMALELL